MRSFFRSLEDHEVEYLLISGQAAILYGAAMFSEDVDLWVDPEPENLRRFLGALASRDATAYKLTPPLTSELADRGHGFHYLLPTDAGGSMYLDVMGRPPRVGAFPEASARAESMETDWGTLPVVAIPDLVDLKRTRRLSDYETISNLAALRLHPDPSPPPDLLRWALEATFRIDDVADWVGRLPGGSEALRAATRPCLVALREGDDGAARQLLLREIGEHQAADVAYWKPVIEELRQLRRDGELLEVGQPIRAPGDP